MTNQESMPRWTSRMPLRLLLVCAVVWALAVTMTVFNGLAAA